MASRKVVRIDSGELVTETREPFELYRQAPWVPQSEYPECNIEVSVWWIQVGRRYYVSRVTRMIGKPDSVEGHHWNQAANRSDALDAFNQLVEGNERMFPVPWRKGAI